MPPILEKDSELELDRIWNLKDGDILKLYSRKNIPIWVEPVSEKVEKIKFEKITITQYPNSIVGTNYQISGDRNFLQNGLLLITWKNNICRQDHDM